MAVSVLSFREMTIELLSEDCVRSVAKGRIDALEEAVSGEEVRALETEGTGRDRAKDPSRSQVLSLEEGVVVMPHALNTLSALRRLLA
jgi:hypothetical protein